MYVIDGHAHIFPDRIAEKASQNIGGFYDLLMRYDGTVDKLLELGELNGINKHLVHSVATSPEQVESINDFIAKAVEDHPERLVGFATLHPDMENPEDEVARIMDLKLKGIKLHPDFQRFYIDDRKLDKIYSAIEGKIPLLLHTGDHRYEYSSPKRVLPVLERFPKLDIICAHFGGWSQWDEAEYFLMGKRVWVDTCSTFAFIEKERALRLIEGFGEDRVIFGCDYPMWDPGEELRMINSLDLPERVKEKIFYKNLCDLLGITS